MRGVEKSFRLVDLSRLRRECSERLFCPAAPAGLSSRELRRGVVELVEEVDEMELEELKRDGWAAGEVSVGPLGCTREGQDVRGMVK
jgi:hypothetical protein